MTKRDEFAAAALAGILSRSDISELEQRNPDLLAVWAFNQADAMLKLGLPEPSATAGGCVPGDEQCPKCGSHRAFCGCNLPEECPQCHGTDIRADHDPNCTTRWCDDCGHAINKQQPESPKAASGGEWSVENRGRSGHPFAVVQHGTHGCICVCVEREDAERIAAALNLADAAETKLLREIGNTIGALGNSSRDLKLARAAHRLADLAEKGGA